ncbi:hypothetical protein D3C84_104320 [compost metagenome]
MLDGRRQAAEAGVGHRRDEHLGERHAVQRRRVQRAAGVGRVVVLLGGVGAVEGHEGVLDHDVVAAGAAQADHVPVALDAEIALRHQEGPVAVALADARGQVAAEEHPVAVLAAGGEAPAPADAVAALHFRDPGHRHVGRGDQRRGILAPHLLLRLLGEQRQLPRMHRHHAVHPGGGHAALGQRLLDLGKHLGAEFEAAVTRGLHDAEQLRLLQRGDHLVGHLQLMLGLCGILGEQRHQRTGAGDQLLGGNSCCLLHRLTHGRAGRSREQPAFARRLALYDTAGFFGAGRGGNIIRMD